MAAGLLKEIYLQGLRIFEGLFFECILESVKSKIALLGIVLVLIVFRLFYSSLNDKPIMLTSYDALGYYSYLPALFVYDDIEKLDWLEEVGTTYGISGDALNSYRLVDNGNKVNKYFSGVAIMQSPFFLVAHMFAEKKDGFSRPYQWSIVMASLFYGILGLFFLRKTLLMFSKDNVVAFTLLLVILSSNMVQYIAVDCGLTHSYLFFLYCVVIYLSSRWHCKPTYLISFFIGVCIGLAVCVRPTELLMVLIPLLWKYPDGATSSKGTMLKDKKHLLLAGLGGAIMILPQALYWYQVTGSLIYDVGSKWSFADPFFCVLFGWEKGWFVYTPVAILFIVSLFYIKSRPFGVAVKWFALLNIYVVISWFDWRYGGSYSTRALSQSYPLFGLSLATMLGSWHRFIYRLVCYLVTPLLIIINLVQVYQYNETILHYDHMNKEYYQAIYMDLNPTPLDYSLLDTEDMPDDPFGKNYDTLIVKRNFLGPNLIDLRVPSAKEEMYIKSKIILPVEAALWSTKFVITVKKENEIVKFQELRLNVPQWLDSNECTYEFYTKWPSNCDTCQLEIKLDNGPVQDRLIEYFEVTKM